MSGTGSSVLNSIANLLVPPQRPIDRLLRPVTIFAQHKLAGAALLMLATAAALIWANSPWEHSYHALLHTKVGIGWGDAVLSKELHHWINDGLMGVFFFNVGLEIKRELLVGELSTVRKATLPAIAALGGIVVPALVYTAFNLGGPGAHGWGIPTATDIAFALGVLALLGNRVPLGLKVFLTALAIVDDIGAVLIIAVFYTSDVSLTSLGFGFVFLAISVIMSRLQVRNPLAYLLIGTLCWLMFLKSGVHATIAAILMAFTIPARTRINGEDLMARIELLTVRMKAHGLPSNLEMNTHAQQRLLDALTETVDHGSAPVQRIEHGLVGPVTFFILPIFALANAGVTIHGGLGDALTDPEALGIVLGLFLGKMIGIFGAAWLGVKLKLADLPQGVTWNHVHGAATLGGIGFTMALFVTSLAFSDPHRVEIAKVAILTASVVSGVVGYFSLRRCKPQAASVPPPQPADIA